MGYRSDVRIVTTRKGFDELKKYTEKYLKEKNYTFGNLLDDLDINHETKTAKYFGWNAIKWYEDCEDYEDVDAVMSGLSHLEKNNFSYRYARIGESYDDYEEQYFDSSKKEEQGLEYPFITRDFADDYIINKMNSTRVREESRDR